VNQGSSISARYPAIFSHLLICLVLLLFFTSYFIDLDRELLFTIVVLVTVATVILVLQFKQLLLFSLGFLIPFSFPMQVFGTSVVNIPSEMICALLSGFLIAKMVTGGKFDTSFLRHPVTILILCDLCWLFICSFFSQMPEVSFKRFIVRFCYYSTFYYFYHELFKQDINNIRRVFTLHTIGFLVPIIYATFNHARLGFTTVGSQRISAPFYYDHTIYGACLVFFIPFLFSSVLNNKPSKSRFLYLLLLIIFTAAAILSYSRAAWLGLIIAAGINLILKYKIKGRYLFYGCCVVVLASAVNWQKIITSLKENKEISHSNNVSMHLKSISNVNTDASNKERINRWKCALRMFADKPLLGFGPGTYQFFYGQYQQREDLTRISTFNGTKGHAHSEYLNYMSETGLPGLLIFLALITVVSTKCLIVIKKSRSKEERNIALFVFTGLVTYFIHAFFNGFLEFDKMAMPVFASFAIVTFLSNTVPGKKNHLPAN
jgi:putative inorganic carbon (hco3(-)) transporter